MPESPKQPSEQHRGRRAAALRGLRNSVVINVLCPYLLYRALAPHFSSQSVLPLGISGLIPLLNLAYSLFRQHALDVLALFAAEDVIVSLAATLLARTPTAVLIGRSSQNAILGLIFLGSLVVGRPLMLYIARQVATGNESAAVARFDQLALRDDVLQVYRFMTMIWAVVLFAKSIVSIAMVLSLSTDRYLIMSPLATYGSDVLLILWSFRYGNARLGHHYATPGGTYAGVAD
jgi:hypothetical protein